MKRTVGILVKGVRALCSVIGVGARAFVVLVGIAGVGAALANYAMTQGSGTNFGSIVVSTVHYAQQLLCDPTTPSQCAKVDASGNQSVTVSNTLAGVAMGDGVTAGNFPTGSPVFAGLFNGTTYDRPRSGGVTGMQGVSLQASPAGGCTPNTPFVPTAGDNHANIKNGAGTACWIAVSNNSATKNYARLYDAGTGFNGCNSATGVIFAFEIPPTDSGFTIALGGVNGLAFSTGLSICITSGFGLTDTTAATATAMYVNVAYK